MPRDLVVAAEMLGVLAVVLAAVGAAEPRCGYEACPAYNPNLINIHIVPHTHMDVGWLKTVDQYYYGDRQSVARAGVRYIISSVVSALKNDPSRKFVLVESAFIWRWWRQQSEAVRQDVLDLINRGQLHFAGGGWSMNDEACPLYPSIIDNMGWGLRLLNDTFGPCGRPLVTWQIDPFGHSREQASLFAQMYIDGLFLGRIDYQDKSTRKDNLTLEMMWKASSNLGEAAHLFTGVLPNSYSPPNGFNFDILSNDAPLMDDPELENYNVDTKIAEFLEIMSRQKDVYKTTNLIVTMGNDFNYQDANAWFTNLDTLIRHVNKAEGSRWNAFYSTPHCYLYSLNQANQSWPSKTDDFFPYASDPHAYWTGYFTSRPAFKGFVKDAQSFLQVTKQQFVLGRVRKSNLGMLDIFRSAVGVGQHHDAITGTAKQVVDYDYTKRLSRAMEAGQNISVLALRTLMKKTDALPPQQVYCSKLNVSRCELSEGDNDFTATAYNPLVIATETYVHVPVNTTLLEVFDFEGRPVKTQILMTHPGLDRSSSAPYDLVFPVALLPLGFRTYFVKMINSIVEPILSQLGRREDSYNDIVISNQILEVTFDGYSGYLKQVKNIEQRLSADISQSFLWYPGMRGDNVGFDRRASGAYIFRPNGTKPLPLGDRAKVKVFKGELVSEVHQIFSPWVTQVIRLYNNSQLLELDWIVGPIPVSDCVGKEIITRFDSNLMNNGTFYTDSNGREVLKRIRNYRPTWDVRIQEPVSANYYPVNSRIFIIDPVEKSQLTIFNDRTQGGASIKDGSIELMVHRRLLFDDGFGVGEPLNEPGESGKGLVIRGTHYLSLTSPSQAAVLQREVARQLRDPASLTFAPLTVPPASYMARYRTSWSALASPGLPAAVHLLTLEPWTNESLLLRFEHIYEADDDPDGLSKPVTFSLQEVFDNIRVSSAREMTLGANQFLDEAARLQWKEASQAPKGKSSWKKCRKEPCVTLQPMQIRTFLVQASQPSQ